MPDAGGERLPTADAALLEASDDSADEDYDPTDSTKQDKLVDDAGSDSGSDAEDALGEYDSGDEKVVNKSVKGKKRKRTHKSKGDEEDEASTEGGPIKTRAQRAQAVEEVQSSAPVATTSASDVDALWAAMNAPSTPHSSSRTTPATTTSAAAAATNPAKSSNESDTIEISRTYEFAGQVHTERKIVPKDSQEARDHLAQLAAAAADTTTTTASQKESKDVPVKTYNGVPLRKVMKRKSILEESAKPKKINTLEKSRMEWSGFVDQEGINDELKRGNKNGFLDRQDFLQKSHSVQYQNWKDGRKS